MKRLITATVLLLAVLLICVFENRYMDNKFSEIKNTVQSIKSDHLNGMTVVPERFTAAEDQWKQSSKILAIFISSEQLDSISQKISGLNTAYNADNYEFIKSIEDILFILDDIEKSEKIDTFGIL